VVIDPGCALWTAALTTTKQLAEHATVLWLAFLWTTKRTHALANAAHAAPAVVLG
jgi:serine phosphatase RsbU (regulator of sigma subunit)